MSGASYNTDSLSWRARLAVRQGKEWLEYQLDQIEFDFPDWDLPDWDWSGLGRVAFWLLVIALTLWLGWMLYRIFEEPLRKLLQKDWQPGVKVAKVRSPEEFSTQYWWQQAQALAKAGNYRDACVALYRAGLQQLHDSQTVLHDPSRTDQEYINSLGEQPLPRPYQLLIRTHERLTFGGAIARAEIFQRCQRAYEEIQKK